MSRTVKIGKVYKRFNSTLQPDVSGWRELEVVWKHGFDIDAPVFTCIYGGAQPPRWNMFFIPDTDAYYWVTRVQSVRNDCWEISGQMDVLATFRNYIMNTDCYIEYGYNIDASGAQYRLPDVRQNVSQVPQIFTAAADITGGHINTKWGAYVLTAVGKSGGVSAYAMGAANIKGLLNSINTTITDEIADMNTIDELFKYFTVNNLAQGSAVAAIRNCVWMPVDSGIFNGEIGAVYLGDYDTGAQGIKLGSNPVFVQTTAINIPWPVSDWKRNNCQILLYLPFIGTVAIPVEQCNTATAITVTLAIECISGGISIKVDAGSYTVYTGSGNIGVPYAIGSSNVPVQNAIGGTVSAVTGAISAGSGILSAFTGNVGEGIATAAQGISQGVSSAVQAIQPVVQCAGTLGGSAAVGQSMQALLCLLYYPPIDDAGFQARFGHPVMRMGKPVAGYCKTRGFSCAADARAKELGDIAQLMDTGVFIE